MFSISNAMMWQVEVVQEDRWEYGPLQLVFIPERKKKHFEQVALVAEWNRSLSGGFSRPADAVDYPQAWNRYSYVRNNPINRTDPTGKCEDPGGRGTRICIATFIPKKTFGGFRGDNRGPNPAGGTFRTQQTINVTKPSLMGVLKEKFTPGISVFGSKARQGEVAKQEVSPSSKGIVAKAEASDGLLYGAAPNAEYNLTLRPTGDGGLKVTGTHTDFPSLEVWRYDNGKTPQLLYHHDASDKSFLGGMVGINRTVEVPDDEP